MIAGLEAEARGRASLELEHGDGGAHRVYRRDRARSGILDHADDFSQEKPQVNLEKRWEGEVDR